MSQFGPSVTENYKYNSSLLKFMDDSSKYVARLSDFDKYCLWRYTIGSASINSNLIFNKLSDNSPHWVYLFFKYHYNTFRGTSRISGKFTLWKKYFDNPELPMNMQIVAGVIRAYTETMQNIILSAPQTSGRFSVFKVASKYPALPDNNSEVPSKVFQLPFNSVTVWPYFNYAPFISPTSDCCLFNLEIPPGSKCLYIPTDLHAYNFEHEIILPHSSFFEIEQIQKTILNYIDPKSVAIVEVQKKNMIRMGNVYTLNEYSPCGKNKCVIQQKPFSVYQTTYINP